MTTELLALLAAAMVAGPTGMTVVGTATPKPPPTYALIMPEKLAVEWNFRGEHRVWLEVRHFNGRDWLEEGFAPNYTEVIVKDYQPRVTKLKDGRWAISFSSPIAADLP